MLPDGIRKASTRKVRRKNQTTSATTIDLVHSHSQIRADRERSAPPGDGVREGFPDGGGLVLDVVVPCAVMRWSGQWKGQT
jgi:hypothetical protein